MVTVERKNGIIRLSGREKGQWMLVPCWPCSARTIRKSARAGLPKEWLDEAAAFADAEFQGSL